jgi:4Fe-4S ferredoxin
MRLGKTIKRRTPDRKVILERRMIGLTQILALAQDRCVGCRDCETICPTEAISSSDAIVENGSLLVPIRMDIDPDLCLFCGQCAIICPTKAILWQENGEVIPALISNGTFPVFDEGIDIQVEKCKLDCDLACEKSCPVQAVTVVTGSDTDTHEDKVIKVEVEKTRCFYCHRCEQACPYDSIEVHSARQGIATFSPERCPKGCYACTEICPSGALHLENGQVKLDEAYCMFCGACQNVCPVDKALEIRPEKIRHYPVRSRLWVDTEGKLVSKARKARLMDEVASRKRKRAFRTRIN